METEQYIKNLVKASHLIHEEILNNDSFGVGELEEIQNKMGELAENLEFFMNQGDAKRFIYELKNHIQWMMKHYS
jgi:hypothetical protein